jgi:hypothetical protein
VWRNWRSHASTSSIPNRRAPILPLRPLDFRQQMFFPSPLTPGLAGSYPRGQTIALLVKRPEGSEQVDSASVADLRRPGKKWGLIRYEHRLIMVL